MKNIIGYFVAGLLGAAIGSALPVLHAQGGYSPELREIQVNGVKVEPKDGVIDFRFQGQTVIGFPGSKGTIFITAAPPEAK